VGGFFNTGFFVWGTRYSAVSICRNFVKDVFQEGIGIFEIAIYEKRQRERERGRERETEMLDPNKIARCQRDRHGCSRQR
jgi:hypothetical protein